MTGEVMVSGLAYNCDNRCNIARQVVFCTPHQRWVLFSLLHMFTYILSVFDCGIDDISTPENWALFYNTTTFGSVVTFECFDNFALLGESERTCQLTGWSNSNPTCGKEWMYMCIYIYSYIILLYVAFKMFWNRLIYMVTYYVVKRGLICERGMPWWRGIDITSHSHLNLLNIIYCKFFICNRRANWALTLEFDGKLCIAVHCMYVIYLFTNVHRSKMWTFIHLKSNRLTLIGNSFLGDSHGTKIKWSSHRRERSRKMLRNVNWRHMQVRMGCVVSWKRYSIFILTLQLNLSKSSSIGSDINYWSWLFRYYY